ncbi:hypothetical protein [Candidatus Enterococcus clewellii]|uniref:Uncharacterized protein n=1 Tax=Candidatus Enterococcus clewellii TaxID=1834193 RepID=A0A242KCG1_9ENTE|nr:hypothetical protein [Enterococcus sp. 9E7_DIV0242]OTP18747.1 hypothetical protein A5888_000561 [Enterococcus sp. 9E7_DIV0242]
MLIKTEILSYQNLQQVNITTGEITERECLTTDITTILDETIAEVGGRNYVVLLAHCASSVTAGEPPSVSQIAKLTGYTLPTVRKAYRELKQKKILL